MYLTTKVALFISSFTVWGFFMALFYHCIIYLLSDFKSKKLLFVSALMFISYYLSNEIIEINMPTYMYLVWTLYDLATLALVFALSYLIKESNPIGISYVKLGLTINALLFFSMYLDINVIGNRESWFLWSLYSIGVNVVDVLMFLALILNRDILGIFSIGRLYKKKLSIA